MSGCHAAAGLGMGAAAEWGDLRARRARTCDAHHVAAVRSRSADRRQGQPIWWLLVVIVAVPYVSLYRSQV